MAVGERIEYREKNRLEKLGGSELEWTSFFIAIRCDGGEAHFSRCVAPAHYQGKKGRPLVIKASVGSSVTPIMYCFHASSATN